MDTITILPQAEIPQVTEDLKNAQVLFTQAAIPIITSWRDDVVPSNEAVYQEYPDHHL